MKISMIMAFAMAVALIPSTLLANGSDSNPDHSTRSEAELALGANAYDARCAVCHTRPATIMVGVPGDDRDERAEWLDVFLMDHYAPEDDIREGIIYWLLDR